MFASAQALSGESLQLKAEVEKFLDRVRAAFASYEPLQGWQVDRAAREVIEAAIIETGAIDLTAESWGPRIEYRGSQVTLSALGQQAPVAEKKAWLWSAQEKRREAGLTVVHVATTVLGV